MKTFNSFSSQFKSSLLLSVLFLSFTFYSCGGKKPATGEEDQIIVIADSTEYFELENSLLTVFGKIIYTPQPETMFHLVRKDLSELNKYQHRKNILIVAPLNSGSKTSDFIGELLNKDVKSLVEADSISLINKKNLWAEGQLVMILSSSNLSSLSKNILKENEDLLHFFQKASNERLVKSLYNERYEQKKLEAQLLKKYGWLIYAQVDYFLAKNDSTEKFVWLRRSPGTDMERWIFVHWIDNASPALLNRDSVNSIRNRITEKYYRAADELSYVEISDDYKSTREVNFLGRYALLTQGLWRMNDGSMGGPFINYTFYDQPTNRLYMLDGSIYAPKFYKKKLIQQVDVILQSFLAEREVSPEKKEDLFDELD